jgi:hypothetical protein
MTQSKVSFLDLPYEILLMIFKELKNIDVLYSLLGVDNQRLDMIVQEQTFTTALKLVATTSTGNVVWMTDTILDRFCTKILPRIDHNIKSLILESRSMERILLAAEYPNLTELKLFNINHLFVSCYFTGKTLLC